MLVNTMYPDHEGIFKSQGSYQGKHRVSVPKEQGVFRAGDTLWVHFGIQIECAGVVECTDAGNTWELSTVLLRGGEAIRRFKGHMGSSHPCTLK